MSEEWNLADGLESVCRSAMQKLYYASHQTEERTRTIINLDSYEITALIWAMRDYLHNKQFVEVPTPHGALIDRERNRGRS